MRRTLPSVIVLLLGLVLPFAGKPVHVDDANFLALARAAAAHPWTPHDALVNWQGRTERAFDVLSNPPGIAWWLAPVAQAPGWVQHLWMLPWFVLAAWGAWSLGARFAGRPAAATLLLCASPVGLLAAQSLMPDLPLFACVLAGLAGVTGPRRAWPWALLAGAAALFRYSGAAIIPLVALWPLLRGDWRRSALLGALSALPLAALWAHDLAAYGQVHMLAMLGFQGVADSGHALFRKLVASVAMLGGAAVLPVLCWSRWRAALVGALVGFGLGAAAAHLSGHTGGAWLTTVLATAAGGATLGGAASARSEARDRVFLLAWLGGGLVFLLTLRFAATRYWLPFLAPAVLLVLRDAPRGLVRAAVLLTPCLALLLAVDDFKLAQAQHDLALRVAAVGTGLFAGHWGWQDTLEAHGWRPLEEDAPVPEGTLFAVSTVAWPQEPAVGCLEPVARLEAVDSWPGPRVHSATGAANFHSFLVSGHPPVETYAPWTFADDPLDAVNVWRGCEDRERGVGGPSSRWR